MQIRLAKENYLKFGIYKDDAKTKKTKDRKNDTLNFMPGMKP